VRILTIVLLPALILTAQTPTTKLAFTAKPVLVHAIQFTGSNQYDIYTAFTNFGTPPPFFWGTTFNDEERQFASTHAVFSTSAVYSWGPDDFERLYVQNPQGLQSAGTGDWIVNVNGRFSVVSPDAFVLLYTAVK